MWRQPGSRWKARYGGASGKNYGRPAEGRHERPAATSEHKGHLSFITGQSPYLYWCEHSKEPLLSALNPLTEATTSNIAAPRPPLHTHHELDGWRGSIFWISRRKRLFRALTSSAKSRLPHPYETLFSQTVIRIWTRPMVLRTKRDCGKVQRLLGPKTFVWAVSPPFDYGHPAETLAEGRSPSGGIASGLLVAERQFRRVIGYREIPLLLSSIENAASKKSAAPVAKGARVA